MKEEFDLFIKHCIWTYECWKMYKIMCSYHNRVKDTTGIWNRFGTILREYVFSQIAKINDTAGYKRNKNLSLEYIVSLPIKNTKYTDSYNKFLADNAEFIKAVKRARNKVTSHNDLNVYKSGKVVGAFSKGLDVRYFTSLHNIISEIYTELYSCPFDGWSGLFEFEVKHFMNKFIKVFST